MNKKFEELIKNIRAMIKCPHCGSRYNKENINVAGQMGQAVLVQLNCHVCKMPVMATIVAKGTQAEKGFISPDSFNQIDGGLDKDSGESISSDEIIEMHDFLSSFNGDFEQLFDS